MPRAPARRFALLLTGFAALWLVPAMDAHAASAPGVAQTFLWMALILAAAKAATLIERLGQPAVLGEILVGVLLGNLALFGVYALEPLREHEVMRTLAELGAVILLFQIGLESNVHALRRVGLRSFWVAAIGVAVPFVLGTYVVGPLLFPGLSEAAYLFLGAALTATSVGITGRVLRDMGALARREAQIVLGAAVIDDVLGLIVLSVVSAIATRGSASAEDIGALILQAIGFLGGALVLGQLFAPRINRLFARIDRGHGMKLTAALATCLVFAYLAHLVGLAPIVGAFAAGLVLEEVHFSAFDVPGIKRDLQEAIRDADPQTRERAQAVLERHARHHLEQMIEPISHLVVPLFFVFAGMQVKLDVFADTGLLLLTLGLTLAAIAGKLACGLGAGTANRWLVGWGMVPRGEVGLIFAFVGKSLGVVNDELFSVIVCMVMLTTLVTPPVLAYLLGPENRRALARRTLATDPEARAAESR